MKGSSLSKDTTYFNGMPDKDKRELVEELLCFREICKAAIQESWNKVEHLRCKCAETVEVGMELDANLRESRAGEETWRIRCLAAEKIQAMRSFGKLRGIDETWSHAYNNKIQQSPEIDISLTCSNKMRCLNESVKRAKVACPRKNESSTPIRHSSTSKHSPNKDEFYFRTTETNMQQVLDSSIPSPSISTSFRESVKSLPITKSYGSNIPEEECLIETDVQTGGETSRPSQFCLRGNARSQEDLSLILSCRDENITSLKQTLNLQLNDMLNMQQEMVCFMKTQRIKEKRFYVLRRQKKECVDKLVVSLRGKLETSDLLSQNQGKNLSECKLLIQELTDELEILVKTIERAKESGFLLDCNSSL